MAGFLKEQFGLNAFIDSTVWGNVADLQMEVDRPLYDSITKTYNYEKRNQSTAYVHLLLSSALSKMLDNTEAVFFLSSPQSVRSNERGITSSAWIYHEIVTACMLRQKYPTRTHLAQRSFSSGGVIKGSINDGYTMEFKIDLSSFNAIDHNILSEWESKRLKTSSRVHSLDLLYHIFGSTHQNELLYD